MFARELARRRIRAAAWCMYGAMVFAALAASALRVDEDQAADVDRCPFDIAPDDPPVRPDELDLMMRRESAAYRAGWDEHERQRAAGDLPAVAIDAPLADVEREWPDMTARERSAWRLGWFAGRRE